MCRLLFWSSWIRLLGLSGALAELAVEEQQAGAVRAGALELLDQQARGLLLLDLLAHEVLEQRQAGVILLGVRERDEGVDALGHLALVGERVLEQLEHRGEIAG